MSVIKNITDLLLIIIIHFICSYLWSNADFTSFDPFITIIFTICAIFTHSIVFFFPFLSKSKQTNKTAHLMIIEIFYFWIFFALLNMAIYFGYNNSFEPIELSNSYEIAFEFIYYIFCNALTFGDCKIIPSCIISKISQIFNIIVFYFIILNWLASFLSEKLKYEE